MIYYADTFDVKAYWAVLDTPLIENGFMFVDTSEWQDTSYAFIKDELMTFTNNFQFTRTQMHADSLIFRINTDCNDNNSWDQAEQGIADYNNDGDMKDILFENNDNTDYNGDGTLQDIVFEFIDRGNDTIDPAETYFDINENGEFDLNEPFEDRNCNDKWDEAEVADTGNGRFDDIEDYTLKDSDGDGTPEKHLYQIGSVPNNILVDWSNHVSDGGSTFRLPMKLTMLNGLIAVVLLVNGCSMNVVFENGNVTSGKIVLKDCHETLFKGEERLVVGVGVKNLIVVELYLVVVSVRLMRTKQLLTTLLFQMIAIQRVRDIFQH